MDGAMTKPEETLLKERACRFFGYENAVLFGRARSGLVAVIEETISVEAPVIIPSNVCSALLAAVVATGRRPVLASVSSEAGLVDDRVLSSAIEEHDGPPGLVLVTHLYGMVGDYRLTEATARRRGWSVLENDSLAATALTPSNKRLGDGKGLLVSFGRGKTVDGGGGGAVLTDDPTLAASLARRAAQWPIFDHAAEQIETHVVLARRHLAALGASEGAETALPIEAAHCRHAYDSAWTDSICAAIDVFPDQNARRMERLEAWRAALASVQHELSAPPVQVRAAWRAIFKARDRDLRDRIVTALRAGGFDAGTNYPPLWDSAPKLVGVQRQVDGDQWGATVMTLWLTEPYDNAHIRAAADIVKRTIDERQEYGYDQ
jgi:dTDP-4-amino-4,6-dideoxygalactose transaminase